MRLLSFKTDFRLLLRSLSTSLGKPRPAQAQPAADAPPEDNTNPYFRSSLLAMLAAKRPVMLIYSEADRLFWEFREKFVDRYAFDPAAHADVLDVTVIKNANHVFTFKEWQIDMMARAGTWLDDHFPTHTRTTEARERADLVRDGETAHR